VATSAKMSSKNQIVVPREAREALGLVAGDRLLVAVRHGDTIEMQKEPADLTDRIEGALAAELGARPLWGELAGE